MDKVIVNGYAFDPETGVEAKKEKSAIEYLRKQVDMSDSSRVLVIYRQIIDQKLFHTQVGYEFLKELQNNLLNNPRIDNSQIAYIEIESPKNGTESEISSKNDSGKKRRGKEEPANDGIYKRRAKIFRNLSIILGVVVIAMFVITLTAKVPTVLNYREQMNDYYSKWEQELTLREEALRDSLSNGQ